MRETIDKTTAFFALSAIGIVAIDFLLSATMLICDGRIGRWIFPLAVGIAIWGALRICRITKEDRPVKLCGYVILGVIVSLIIGLLTIDYSYDGLVYHQEMIALMCDGWNPYYEYRPAGIEGDIAWIWDLHYAKGIEIVESTVVAFTGRIESGKAINLIMTCGVGMAVVNFLYYHYGALRRRQIWLIALAVMANPVIWAQILTYYIDFYKYLYLLIVVIGMIELGAEDTRRRHYGGVLMVIGVVMSVATKFNFFAEAGIWGLAGMIWVMIKGEWSVARRYLCVGGMALIAGVLLNWHPYITNWQDFGHPFYPLLGEGAEDIMTGNTPGIFLEHGRIENFLRTILTPQVMIAWDQRIGGFTILMPMILLIAGIGVWRVRREVPGVVWYMAVLTLLSCFIFEQSWWARYICQLWLLPALFLPYAMLGGGRFNCGRIESLMMILAGLYTMAWSLKHEYVIGGYHHILMQEAAKEGGIEVTAPLRAQYKWHLREAGIYYRLVASPEERDDKSEGRPVTATEAAAGSQYKILYYSEHEEDYRPMLRLSSARAEEVKKRLENRHLNYTRYEYQSEASGK